MSGTKGYTAGTHRDRPPEQTLARVAPWLGVLGITRIANVTGLDEIGIPVVIVSRPNSRSLAVAQGKGVTLDAARASGVMESLEFWHAERVNLPLLLGSALELGLQRRLVDHTRLPRLEVSRFDEHERILWVEGRDLIADEAAWVPYECVHTDFRLPLPAGSGCFAMNSNGLASGNRFDEALTHAICEVIERDATALWCAGGVAARRTRRLDLETVADPLCQQLLAAFSRAGVLAAVWDTTTDIGVPCFACEIVDDEAHAARSLGASAGMGCHPSPAIALARALTEAAQGRLTRISSSRDDIARIDYEVLRNPDVAGGLRAELGASRGVLDYRRIEGVATEFFEADLAWLLQALRGVGVSEVIAVDLTHPRIGIPVVRAIVPGLEGPHEAPGYLPGPRARAVRRAGVAVSP